MRRREFIGLLGMMVTWPLGWAHAQPATKVPKVGFLYPGPQQAAVPRIEAFLSGLRAAGYPAPAQVELLVRTAEGDPRKIAPLVAEIIDGNVEVFFAIGSEVVQAAWSATRTIPIVAIDLETDPVGSGMVTSLARPGGNITGIFFDFPDFTSKWLQLLKETVPHLVQTAVLWDPATPQMQLKALEGAAASLGIQLDVLEVRTQADFGEAFATASRGGATAVLMLSSPLFPPNVQKLAELAVRHNVPAITLFPDFARAGGLLAYGPNLLNAYRQLGVMVSKVLKGAKPADLPIELPTRFELVLNMRTAKALGVVIPTSVLLRADEVIE